MLKITDIQKTSKEKNDGKFDFEKEYRLRAASWHRINQEIANEKFGAKLITDNSQESKDA